MIPTRIIEKEEFMSLSEAEGGIMEVWKLTNIPFDPPLPDGDVITTRQMSMNILLMNVTEPVIYKDYEHNMAFVIINGYDPDSTFTYDNFRDIHIIKDSLNGWGYVLHPAGWELDDEDCDMEDAEFRFRHEEWFGQGDDEVKEAA